MARKENSEVPHMMEPNQWFGLSEEPQEGKIITDPNGSYTGRPKDPADRPIQDADDL